METNMENKMREENRLLNLTDDEWVRLIDGYSEDSLLQHCCANISALRDELITMLRCGRNRSASDWELKELRDKLQWVAYGHEIAEKPVFKKLIAEVGGLSDEHHAQTKRI